MLLNPSGNLRVHRLAQWEGQSKRYYYVQRATGISTWDIPTQPAPSVPTPGPTPQQGGDPFSQPSGSAQYGGGSDSSTKPHDGPENYQGADRSFLSVCWVSSIAVFLYVQCADPGFHRIWRSMLRREEIINRKSSQALPVLPAHF